jgi:hypothetical protein
MTTQTTLSAACPPRRATVVERETSAPPSSSSSFPASLQKPWLPRPARRGGRLIANARLESPATVRKQSIGTTSNRKWIAFFPFAPLATHRSSLAAQMSREDPPRGTTNHLPQATALPWPPWPARRGGRLIANARLESPATARKQSIGNTSNRKWIAIFQFTPQLSRSSFDTALPWPTWPARRGGRLIANARLESSATVRKQSIGTGSNRKRIAIFRFAPLATHHSSLVAQMSREDPPRRTTCHSPLQFKSPVPRLELLVNH